MDIETVAAAAIYLFSTFDSYLSVQSKKSSPSRYPKKNVSILFPLFIYILIFYIFKYSFENNVNKSI